MKRIRLMPGVFLTCAQTKQFKCSQWYAGLTVPLDPRDAALNALLPRVLRQGTADHPDQQSIARYLEELYGGMVEPSVTKRGEVHWIGFRGRFLDEALVPGDAALLDSAARLLGDLLLRPATRNGRLQGEFVEREKQHLIEQIQRSVNLKEYYAMEQAVEKMCAGEAYRVGPNGTLREAKRLSVARLTQHYRKNLSSAAVELYYSGSAAPERVERAWRDALRDLPRARTMTECHTDWLIHPGEVRRFTETMAVSQARLVMGFRTLCTLNSPGYPALIVANALLGGGASSRLFTTMREQRSLCYAIHSSMDKHKGLLLIQAGVAADKLELTEEEILHQLLLLQQGEFSEEELRGAIQTTLSQLRRTGDSQLASMDYAMGQTMAELRMTPDELAEKVAQVTREQVVQTLLRLALDSVYTLRPQEQEEVPQE